MEFASLWGLGEFGLGLRAFRSRDIKVSGSSNIGQKGTHRLRKSPSVSEGTSQTLNPSPKP